MALAPTLILAVIVLAYHNSLHGPFAFDDAASITNNPSIRHLWPLSSALFPPAEAGVGGRPLANLSFAINYALSGLDVRSYHVVNLALHVASALVLFGVIRGTLLTPCLRPRFAGQARPLACAAVLLWSVHPLTTSTVNYVSQRTELLMALSYLVTLYAAIRYSDTSSFRWRALAFVACAAGMASKEVMVTAPLVVLLYDRVFLGRSWREVWMQRKGFYVSLASTWLLLAGLMATSHLADRGVGLDLGISAAGYAFTQASAVLHYLRLAVWPDPLVFDYGWSFAGDHQGAALPTTVTLLVIIAIGWLAARRPQLGFGGLAALLILAPTSSFIPIIQQPLAENRMYLPLAALVATLVPAFFSVLPCQTLPVVIAIAVAFTGMTFQRNQVFQSEITLWSDTLAKRPANARAHANLSAALLRAERPHEAIAAAQRAVHLRPTYADAHHNLALGLARVGQLAPAIEHYRTALQLNPHSADTHYNLAHAFAAMHRPTDAIDHLKVALQLNPRHVSALNDLSVMLLQIGNAAEAAVHARAALQIDPERPDAHYNLGNALTRLGQQVAAIASYEAALRLDPNFAKAHNNLGVLRLQSGDTAAAVRHFEAALRADPAHESARRNLDLARDRSRH